MAVETAVEKVRLVMEETGCDQSQAQVALELARFDVAKAIRTMGALLRHINVVKGKCRLDDVSLYGLFLLVADVKSQFLLRLRCVTSYNPALYETPLETPWYEFERKIYSHRLAEGSQQQLSQELEQLCYGRLRLEESKPFFNALGQGRMEEVEQLVRETFSTHFRNARLTLTTFREELNLDQYRQMQDTSQESPDSGWNPTLGTQESNLSPTLALQVAVPGDIQGSEARDLAAGDVIHCQITDTRDIAQYLSRLLGGKSEDEAVAMPATIEAVRREGNDVALQVRFAPGILGEAQLGLRDRVRVVRRRESSWWDRLIPWWD